MKRHFFYPSDLVNTKTTIPLRVREERLCTIHLPLEDSCILSPNFSHFSFERIIYNQLSSYLSENNISYQSGLSLNVTALLEVTDNGAFNIDRGSVIAVVFLDLKKSI